MGDVFEAKVRRVGNSLGIIIPGEVARRNGLKQDDRVLVALPIKDVKERNRFIRSIAGKYADKGGPFVRDKEDRF